MSVKSIRSFIGAQEFEVSKAFYSDLGFTEITLSDKMSYFQIEENFGFYLQNYSVKDWVDNSMLFLEVEDVEAYHQKIKAKDLTSKYIGVRLSEIVKNDWGKEFFLHDPSGILWHIGSFY